MSPPKLACVSGDGGDGATSFARGATTGAGDAGGGVCCLPFTYHARYATAIARIKMIMLIIYFSFFTPDTSGGVGVGFSICI